MDEATSRWVYEFGDFRLDASRRLLTTVEDNARVAIAPKVFEASLYLVERAGKLIPKSRMLADLWPGSVVEENSLTQLISDLRRALGESRGENRYVVTLPRRGYQFVAEVARVTLRPAVTATPDRTVAVLPFENLARAAEYKMVATGIAESILHRLAEMRGLRLVSQASSFGLRGLQGDARQIDRRVGARYLVQGCVQHAGERLRITAQLIDTADGSHLWSMMFDRPATDVFAIEDDVSMRVAREIRASLLAPGPLRFTAPVCHQVDA